MLVQENQADMPQHLVLCIVMKKFVLRVYAFKTRVYIDTFNSKPNNIGIL